MNKIKLFCLSLFFIFNLFIYSFAINIDDINPPEWVELDGKWYYVINDSLEYQLGWIEWNGNWYYTESNGVMATNKWVDGQMYYVGSDGVMLADTDTPDGYHVGPDGKWDGNQQNLNNANNPDGNGNRGDLDDDQRTLSGGIKPVKFFSKMESIGGEDYQFDFFGITMSKKVGEYRGNKEYLSNVDSENTFKDLLTAAHYKYEDWKSWLERLRKEYEIDTRKFVKKETMTNYALEQEARVQRTNATNKTLLMHYLEAIVRGIGIILIAYGFIVLISGVIDELGLMNKYMTSMVTGNKINKDSPTMFVGSPAAFRYMYLMTSLLIILVGILCLAPDLREWLITKFIAIVNIFRGFFGKGAEIIQETLPE